MAYSVRAKFVSGAVVAECTVTKEKAIDRACERYLDNYIKCVDIEHIGKCSMWERLQLFI